MTTSSSNPAPTTGVTPSMAPLLTLFHVGSITLPNLINLAHQIWEYLCDHAAVVDAHGAVDLAKVGILFHTLDLNDIQQKIVSQAEAVELIFLHSLLPNLSAAEQAIVQEFVNQLLPPLLNSFQKVYALALEKGKPFFQKMKMAILTCCGHNSTASS